MNIFEQIQREVDFEILAKCKKAFEEQEHPKPPFDFTCIYSIGTDGRVHVLHHSKNIPDILCEDIKNFESECVDNNSAPGVYKGSFQWESDIDRESGIDEGYFIISEDAELLYQLPDEYTGLKND